MNELLQQVATEFGTPCYVYCIDQIRSRCQLVKDVFGSRFQISYAVKCNPNRGLLERLRECVDLLDISSVGELHRAIDAGWSASSLSFTGPGKRPHEIEEAVRVGIGEMVVESVPEAIALNRYAEQLGRVQPVLVRISPAKLPRGFGVRMAGRPSQFGIDEEDIDLEMPRIQSLSNLEIRGLHIYSGTQCLNTQSVIENYSIMIDLFRRVAHTHDLSPQRLVFGSGLGIPYYQEHEPIDLNEVASETCPMLDALRGEQRFSEAKCVLETGRFIVGEAGYFLTGVVARKHSRGTEFAILDGGMNHHLGACGHLGTVIHQNHRMFKVSPDGAGESATQKYDLVGPLCTTIDTVGHDVELTELEIGDVIAIQSSGAYGRSASPLGFISHKAPKEILLDVTGTGPDLHDVTESWP
ncbi:L-glutamyl-[BtrI acyl-carrier protein] decarboxylase [Stieleria maiorica]|uniref:L-glutamyl-[BtrI acyl-carrier protein] decarboxylase n=1 Tax=Stieleria maiorica TaxID=2795974 RepID=A0A5B9MEC7_9BACT|nr:type III PLP-dependent enzyme [Stieleria maiorica]QEF99631.1 L-glutamyl-[BtrI acyl-carrier protein] decarboxylase [Stieleria maiorica]